MFELCAPRCRMRVQNVCCEYQGDCQRWVLDFEPEILRRSAWLRCSAGTSSPLPTASKATIMQVPGRAHILLPMANAIPRSFARLHHHHLTPQPPSTPHAHACRLLPLAPLHDINRPRHIPTPRHPAPLDAHNSLMDRGIPIPPPRNPRASRNPPGHPRIYLSRTRPPHRSSYTHAPISFPNHILQLQCPLCRLFRDVPLHSFSASP